MLKVTHFDKFAIKLSVQKRC